MVLLAIMKCIPRSIIRSRVFVLSRSFSSADANANANSTPNPLSRSQTAEFPQRDPDFNSGARIHKSCVVDYLMSYVDPFSSRSDFSPAVLFEFLQWIKPHIPPEFKQYTHAAMCPLFKAGAFAGGVSRKPPPISDYEISKLQSYLKSGRASDAHRLFREARSRHADFCFFHEYTHEEMNVKLCRSRVASLCRVKTADHRLEIMRQMEETGFSQSLSPDEFCINHLCAHGQYDQAFELLDNMERDISTFIGNLFLWHSFESRAFYKAWRAHSPGGGGAIGDLIATFSRGTRLDCHPQHLEEAIQRCFPLDVFTYNLLLRKLGAEDLRIGHERHWQFLGLFSRMCLKGFVNNRSFDVLIHGLSKHGRSVALRLFLEELSMHEFYPNPTPDSLVGGFLSKCQNNAGFKEV